MIMQQMRTRFFSEMEGLSQKNHHLNSHRHQEARNIFLGQETTRA